MTSGVLSLIFLIFFATFSSSQVCLPTAPGSASNFIGQPDDTSAVNGGADNQFDTPRGVYVHPTSQKVFVSDYSNGRVQRFNSSAALLNGSAAEITAFGILANFTVDQNTLGSPYQLTMYNTTLFISDAENCRVMRVDGATTANATVALATNVYGQPDFTSSFCGATTPNDFNLPYGVASSINQTLWVSDSSNRVVKRFDNILAAANYPAPNAYFGINGTSNVTQNTFSQLQYLAIDKTNGHLFVADGGRVLLFKFAQNKANSSDADTVFGSTDFNSTSMTCNSSSVQGVIGLHYDSNTGSLFVADRGNYRVLVFSSPISAVNGSAATAQLGQPDFTTCAIAGTANASNIEPWDVTYSPDLPGLFALVVDDGFNRVSRHQCANSTFSATATRSASVPASSLLPNSSSGPIPASSSGPIPASSSGPVPASSSGGVAASSSGGVAASSSGGVAASSSGGVAASSSGVVVVSSSVPVPASSSGAAPASSSGAVAPSSVVPPSGSDSASGPALSGTDSTTISLSNSPSETNPNALTPSNSAIAPPPPVQFGTSGVVLAVCGNGRLEAGEECDPGAAVPRTRCCTQFCTNLAVRSVCGRAASQCTRRPKCGRSATSRQLVCNPGTAKPVGTRCGRGGLFSRKTCQADGTCQK